MEKELLYFIMYSAFVQIRARAYEDKDKFSFRICDSMHNIPLKLLNATCEKDYQDIYLEFKKYINHNGMEPWLDQEIEQAKIVFKKD